MNTTIRPAAEPDLPAILEITNEAIRNSTALWTITPATLQSRREWALGRAAEGFPVLVAEQAGHVLGFGSYGRFRPFEGYAHTVEHSLYVHKDARRLGVGRSLLAALLDHAAQAGKHVMIGGIEARNAGSISLHEQAGFTRSALLLQVGRKFDRWLDLLFMQKRLGLGDPLDANPPNADPTL